MKNKMKHAYANRIFLRKRMLRKNTRKPLSKKIRRDVASSCTHPNLISAAGMEYCGVCGWEDWWLWQMHLDFDNKK